VRSPVPQIQGLDVLAAGHLPDARGDFLAMMKELISHDGMGRKDVSLLEVPAMAISSTDCRTRVAEGNPVWYLVPDGVVQYIAKYGLYHASPDADRFEDGHAGTANAGNGAAGTAPAQHDPAFEITQPASTE